MSTLLRAARIGRVLLRYRLDDLLDDTPAERWLKLMRPFVPRAAGDIAARSRGARLRLALQELGPIFVKFGQILSTRRDLLPPDLVDELALLQDQVAPFDGDAARAIVEAELEAPVATLYASFDTVPLASASIAQVHAATLPGDGGAPARQVVVKVLRPGIEKQVAADIAVLRSLAGLVERTHPRANRIRPREIVAEIESTLAAELDLQREGANASVLRRNWLGSADLYVPEPVWSHTAERVLTLERVRGIPADDIAALDAAGIDRKALAAKGVRVFYTQVFRDNFFHADAHAGSGHHAVVRHHRLPPGHSREDALSSSGESRVVVEKHLADGEPEVRLRHGPVDHQSVPGGQGSHVHEVGGIAVVVLHPVFGEHRIPHGLPRLVVAHGTMGACGHHDGDPR